MNPVVELILRIVAANVVLACLAVVLVAIVEFTLYIINHHNKSNS